MIFHSGIVGVAVGYVGVRFLYNKKQKTYTLNASSVLAAVVLSVVFMYLYNRYSSLFFGKMSDIDELSDIASGYGRGGSSYASIAGNSSNIVNFIIYTPIRIFLFLFTPLFFQIRGLSDIIAMVFSAFFYMWAYYMAFKALKTNKRDKNLIIALLIVAISVAFIFGWGGTNIGTNVRHRDKVMPIYITLLAISFERRPREIKEAEITKLTD